MITWITLNSANTSQTHHSTRGPTRRKTVLPSLPSFHGFRLPGNGPPNAGRPETGRSPRLGGLEPARLGLGLGPAELGPAELGPAGAGPAGPGIMGVGGSG